LRATISFPWANETPASLRQGVPRINQPELIVVAPRLVEGSVDKSLRVARCFHILNRGEVASVAGLGILRGGLNGLRNSN
jgi:hypothetical protein